MKNGGRGTGQDGKITLGDARRALAAGKQERQLIRDGMVRGLYLRTGARGGMWSVEYKPPGRDRDGRRHKTRHLRLGNVQALSPDDARRDAAQAKQQVLLGQDPQAHRKAAQAKAVAPGWAEVRDDYLAYLQRRLPHPRSRQNEISCLEAVFTVLNPDQPLRTLGLPAVHQLLDRMPVEGVLARQRLGAFGRLHDWARARDIIDTPNPVRLLPRGARPKSPAPRRRALTLAELGPLWRHAEALVLPLERDLLRLLIALPLRKGEASALEWAWIDRGAGAVTLPGKVMKTGEDHALPLGAMACGVLDAIAGGALGGVWPATGRVFRSDNSRGADWTRFKRRIDAVCPLPDWSFHDFRRSFVSLLAEHGHAEAVLDQMLSHRASSTRSGVLAVYQVARRLPEQRAAMAAWDALLAGAINNGVVQLHA